MATNSYYLIKVEGMGGLGVEGKILKILGKGEGGVK